VSETLAVWTSGFNSGLLAEDAGFVFNYQAATADTLAVSLTMPVRLKSWTSRSLHPVFQMNLPEGALLEAIRNAIAKIASPDDLTLLRLVGTNQIGRNRFTRIGEELPKQETPPETLSDILKVADSEKLFEELMSKYALKSGVSGIQPKVLLETDERATIYASSWIVKSSGADYPYLAANEYFCMSAVKEAGLPVPEFHLSDDGRMFVMKRFDQRPDDGKPIGFEDFCALQGLGTLEKYSGSYERAVKTIDYYVSPAFLLESRTRFFTLLVLSVILRNGDAHLKNFGVLYPDPTGEDRKLAPAYDVVTTVAYLRNDIPALSIDGSKKWWDRKTLIRFGNIRCGLGVSAAQQILERCLDAVSQQSRKLQRYIRQHPPFAEIGRSMLSAWKQGLQL
jgi:serine/threonine-protein kinase HipA